MTINTIIITKNKARREKIEHFIQLNMLFTVIDAFPSIIEAYHFISQNSIDIIFTDVKNNDFHTLLQAANIDLAPAIIHLAFEDNSKSSEEISTLNMSAQLFKDGIFNKITNKILEKNRHQSIDVLSNDIPHNEKKQTATQNKNVEPLADNFIFIRTNYSFTKIFYDDILYIKAMENFVQVVTVNDTYTTLVSLKNMLAKLPAHLFKQVHRSYIVNFHKIQALEKNTLKIDKNCIPLGAAFKDGIVQILIKKRSVKR